MIGLTEKLKGRRQITPGQIGLPLFPETNQESTLYKLAKHCKDYQNLQLSLVLRESPDKDLMDQHYELCTHPAEEIKESCGNYKMIRRVLVEGAEETLRSWHPGQVEPHHPTLEYLRGKSNYNKLQRFSKRGMK